MLVVSRRVSRLVKKASASQDSAIRRGVEATASRQREAKAAEGTSGAADSVLFREGAQEAALQGRSSFGETCWAIPFERDRNRTVVGLGWAFKQSRTRDRDRGCSSQSGWGKSTAASGRRGGGRKGRKARATPGLRQLGW
jgi:hypothetical protein